MSPEILLQIFVKKEIQIDQLENTIRKLSKKIEELEKNPNELPKAEPVEKDK